ncbi:MAG: hypothetical protein ACOC1F_08405 [Myxococcota bacterium]
MLDADPSAARGRGFVVGELPPAVARATVDPLAQALGVACVQPL